MSYDNDLMNEIYLMLGKSECKKLSDIIAEKIATLDTPKTTLAKILNIDKSTFDRMLKKIEDGEIDSIDFFHILKMCQFFNISVEEVAQIYVASLKAEHVSQLEIAKTANFLYRNFDLKGLKDVGFINSLTDIKAIENRFLTFFN